MLFIIGAILCFIGGLWLVVNGFRSSVWWGLGNLLIPFVALIFGIMNFAENKVPLLIYVVGAVLLFAGGGLSAADPSALSA